MKLISAAFSGLATSALGACLLQALAEGSSAPEAGEQPARSDVRFQAWWNSTGCESVDCILKRAYPDEQQAWKSTGDTTEIYGEVTVPGMEQLLGVFSWGPHAHFYDLGCGTGRIVLFASLTKTLARAVGVEKVTARLHIGQQAIDALEKMAPKTSSWVRPELIGADFADMDFSDATAIYLSSLYFPDEVMWMLAHRLSEMQEGARIATMVRFPHDRKRKSLQVDSPLHNLREVQQVSVPMSWTSGEGVPIYVYEVSRKAARRANVLPVEAGATVTDILETLKAVVDLDTSGWTDEASAFMSFLSSLEVSEHDKLAIFGTGAALDLPLRIVIAILGSPAHEIAAISEDSYHREAVENLVATLKKYAPSHVAWHRIVKVHAELPRDCSVVVAGGNALPAHLLRPGALIAGHYGCLPGLDVLGDGRVLLAPSGYQHSQIEELHAQGDVMLDISFLRHYMQDVAAVDARLRLQRFAKMSGFKGQRVPARQVARWLLSAFACPSDNVEL